MEVVSREQWLVQRMELLKSEKNVTRELDALAKQRQEMPWVAVRSDYTFDLI